MEEQFLISELVSLTIADTVKTLVPDPEKLSIKWPNDIYYGDRKLAGILIENRVSGGEWRDCIVGIGLNVNQEKFVSEAPNPISLRQITQTEISREYVTETFLNLFETIWTAPPEYAAAHAQYRRQLYRRTGIHPYRDAEGLFEAELLDVTTHGQLLLYDIGKRERRTYAFKEVGFIMGESS